ncbi:MAG: MOSC domain-containing protein [Actinomycetia bacterium]|nr:MOSC domain-containing protein [Actinomycetes bacterium]
MSFEGHVTSIHRAPVGSAPMVGLDRAELVAGEGITGDRYALGSGHYSSRPHVDRQITLIESEVLDALRRDHDVDLRPEEHRRNITTAGVPVNHLVGSYFRVGSCVLYGGRLNVPCAYLQELVDKRVFRPLVHRSGLNARIIIGGSVAPGDPIGPVDRADLDPGLVAANERTPVEPAPEVI